MFKFSSLSGLFGCCLLALNTLGQQDTTTLDKDILSWRWETKKDTRKGTFLFTPYKPVYVLPFYYTTRANEVPKSFNPAYQLEDSNRLDLDQLELKFQFSFKTKAVQGLFWGYGDLWVAYTQTSRWQLYNGRNSRPFRETNYEPEVILNLPLNIPLPGFKICMFGMALNHQSNGRNTPLSRSWNRIIYHVGLERKQTELLLRMWHRIPDNDDENPLITKYLGAADALFATTLKGHHLSLMLRQPLTNSFNKGAVQMEWSMPISGHLKTSLQFFHGYGESLIDYNHKQTTIGVGVSLVNWL